MVDLDGPETVGKGDDAGAYGQWVHFAFDMACLESERHGELSFITHEVQPQFEAVGRARLWGEWG
jgi:hypothetical protein